MYEVGASLCEILRGCPLIRRCPVRGCDVSQSWRWPNWMEVEMNDRSVRMVMFGALLAALVACGSNSQPAKPQSEATGTQFASADDLGKWLSSNGFGCTRDDRLGGVYMCTYA